MKTILFLDHSTVLGGAEKSLLDIIERLIQYRCILVVPAGATIKEATKRGIETRLLKIPEKVLKISRSQRILVRDIFLLPVTILRFLSIVLEVHPVLIHTNTLKAHIIGCIASKIARTQCIIHMRDILTGHKLYMALISMFSTKIIAISEAVKKNIRYSKEVYVVYNGIAVDNKRDNRRMGDTINIGTIGQLAKWKGVEYFIKAAGLLSRQHTKRFKFWVIGDAIFGDDDYKRYLQDMSEELGLLKSIEFTGWVQSPLDLMEKLDIVVHTPIHPEPFGRVLIEAGLLNKPVVATNIGAIPEIILDGKTGLLVPPKDANAISHALTNLIKDRNLMKSMGKAGRERVKNLFSIEKTTRNISNIIKDTIGE